MLRRNQILLIYDGSCGFCSGVVRVLGALDWRRRIVSLPYQTPSLLEIAGIEEGLARRTSLVLSPSGKLWQEGGSMVAAVDELLPLGLPLLRSVYTLPGLHRLIDAAYRLLARNRGWFAVWPPDLCRAGPPSLDEDTRAEIGRRRLASQMPSALVAPLRPSLLH